MTLYHWANPVPCVMFSEVFSRSLGRNKTLGCRLSYLFNTREWYISICLFLIVLLQWSQKRHKKSPGGRFSLDSGGGAFYKDIYYFLVVSWRKRFSLSVHDGGDAGWCSGPQFGFENVSRDGNRTVLRKFRFKRMDRLQPNESSGFFLWTGKDLKMTARKKTAKSCPDFSFYKKQTGPTSTPNSWSGAPMSIGAISMIGRRDVFVVL